jgi:hypothetical protein
VPHITRRQVVHLAPSVEFALRDTARGPSAAIVLIVVIPAFVLKAPGERFLPVCAHGSCTRLDKDAMRKLVFRRFHIRGPLLADADVAGFVTGRADLVFIE